MKDHVKPWQKCHQRCEISKGKARMTKTCHIPSERHTRLLLFSRPLDTLWALLNINIGRFLLLLVIFNSMGELGHLVE